MYCLNCGKPVQDGTPNCPSCGAPMGANPSSNPNPYANVNPSGYVPQPSPPSPKGSKNIKALIVGITVGVLVSILTKYALMPALFEKNTDTDTTSSAVSQEEESSDSKDAASEDSSSDETSSISDTDYYSIFSNRDIVHISAVFPNLETASFVGVDEEIGMVDCMEFGYKADLILALTETCYLSLEGYTEDERSFLDEDMRAAYAEYEEYDFCTMTYDMTNSYYVIRFEFTDLDKPENCQKLIEWGLLEENTILISLRESEKNLLSEGYVKK